MWWVHDTHNTPEGQKELIIRYYEFLGKFLTVKERTVKTVEEFDEWYQKNKLL